MEFTEPAMRPPQEAQSLLLRCTQGCTYNDCHFCYVSRGYPFLAVTPEHLEEEARRRKVFFPADTRVYLTGSNPFALPGARLKEYIAALRRQVPRFSALTMQSRIDDIAAKSDDELRELREGGLSHLYIGTENGDEEALALMNKGHTAEDSVVQLLRLDAAGIAYTCFYVLGLGGRGRGRACGEATARMFNRVRPIRVTTTGMTVFPGSPLADMAAKGDFVEASEREKIEELLVFLEHLECDTFYDGVHYLNPLNYRLRVRDEAARAAVLADIREALASHSDEELELMVSRERMKSL